MKKTLVGIFALVAAFAAQATVYRAGFRQGRFWLNSSKTIPSFNQDAYTATSWDWTLSAFMCNVTGNAGASGVNPVSGMTWDWQHYYGYVYDGEMWMDAGTTYTFGGNFDDGSAILVDGEVVWAQGEPGGTNSGYTNWVEPQDYTPDETGWHKVKLLVYDWEGGKAITCDALSATMWNTNGVKTAKPTSDWNKFVDDGSGALFRAKLADAYLRVVTAGATANGYAVTVENLAPQEVEMKIFAGASDQGETATGWTAESQTVSFAAGETKDIEFAWNGSVMPVYRIYLSGEDTSLLTAKGFWEWSEARTFLFVPSIAASFVSTNETSAAISVTCGYAESLTGRSPDIAVTAYYGRTNGGHDPSAWANSKSYAAMQPGIFTDTFTCLLGTRCSVVFAASIDGGEPVWSDVLTFGVTLISPNDFAYRADVTFPGFTGETPLSDFPVLVRLTETEGGFAYSQAAAGGADLRFALDDGTPLDSEVAVWDETGESLVWVRLPELTDNTTITLYWGGTDTAFPDSQTDGSVWGDASYVGVWHLEESGDTLADATANGLDGTRHGTVGRVAAGLAGAGHRISDGSSGVGITIPNYDALSVGNSFTISAWLVYPQGQTPGYDRLFSRKGNYNDGNGWEVTMRNGSTQNIDHRGANGDAQDSAVFSDVADGKWHYLAVAYDGNTSSVFVDGVQKISGKSIGAAPTDNGKLLVFGNNAAYAETTFKGTFDEIRLRDAVTDEDWAAAEWASVSDPAFAVIGPVEAIDLDLPSIVAPTDIVAAHHAASFLWTLREAGSSAATVVAELGTESGVYTRTVTLDSGLTGGASDTATVSGLQCATTYYLRLSASNESGTYSSVETTFSTLGGASFSDESLAVSGEGEVTASATVTSANPDATVAVSLLFGAAGATPAVQRVWTATTNPQAFAESVSGLLFGDYEAHFEAESTCSVCGGVSTAESETVAATLAGECRWTGAAGDFSWNTPGNWSSGTVPGPLDTVVFPAGSVTAGTTISLGADQSVTAILDQSGVSFQIGSADDASAGRVLSAGDYVRNGEDNVTLRVGTPFRFAATESGTNRLTVAAGTVRFGGAVTAVTAHQPVLQSGAGTVALAAAGGTPQPDFLVVAGVLQPETGDALRGNATIGGGDVPARLNCTVNQALSGVDTVTVLTNGTALLRQIAWGHMAQNLVAQDGATIQIYDYSQGYVVRLRGATLQGGFMNCGSYSGQGIFSYASAIPSFFRAGFNFSQHGGAPISVEDGEAIIDLTITGGISWGAESWNSLSKNGAGTLRMTGTFGGTSSQPFQLNVGTLLCDNVSGTPIGNTLLNVKAGATLGGTGFVGGTERGNVAVSGTSTNPGVLAPGTIDEETGAHLYGTLTVGTESQTNLVSMGSWTKLVAGVGSRNSETGLSDFDKLMVHGDLSIGENCVLDLISSSAKLDEIKGGVYTIVEADRIDGTFATVQKPKNSWKVAYVGETVDDVTVVKRIDVTVPSVGLSIVIR